MAKWKPVSPEQKKRSADFRNHVHRHNGYSGNVGMMNAHCYNMAKAESLTPEAKALVSQIQQLAWQLAGELKNRVDPPHLLPIVESTEVS